MAAPTRSLRCADPATESGPKDRVAGQSLSTLHQGGYRRSSTLVSLWGSDLEPMAEISRVHGHSHQLDASGLLGERRGGRARLQERRGEALGQLQCEAIA